MTLEPISSPLPDIGAPCEERERRQAVRCRCDLNSSCRRPGIRNVGSWLGTAQDISIKGISLVLNARLKLGTFLDVSLERADGQSFAKPLMVRVRHIAVQPDGTRLFGCSFVNRITDEDLHALLRDG